MAVQFAPVKVCAHTGQNTEQNTGQNTGQNSRTFAYMKKYRTNCLWFYGTEFSAQPAGDHLHNSVLRLARYYRRYFRHGCYSVCFAEYVGPAIEAPTGRVEATQSGGSRGSNFALQ